LAHSFLTTQNIFKRYREAKDYTDKLTKPFDEFARQADNKPQEGMPAHYPDVTSGIAAGIIQKVPKTAVQQLPTGVVETDDDNDWLPIVAQFVYTNKILPCANEDYGLFEKCHMLIEAGETFGFCATYDRFDSKKLSPDVELIYWGDISIQKGKKSGKSCNYVFYRTWWQKADLEALIDAENQRAANAKRRKEEYIPTWDVVALKSVLDQATSKDQQATTPTEEDRALDADGIELITGFQYGIGAKFFTFNPQAKKIVRTKVNNHPAGKMPIQWFYYDIDGTNPLGRGIPQLVGPMVNLYDTRLQMQQYGDTLSLAPPVIEYGEASDSFEFLPNKVIHATNDQTYKIEPVNVKATSTPDFISGQNFLQSQIYQLDNTPHTGLSSTNSTVNDGKTPTALNMQQNTLDVDINAVVKHFESWFEDWSEDAINRYFAERQGKELLQLDSETADKLRQLEPSENFDPQTAVSADDTIIIDYDTATPHLKFRIDASTSKMKDNANQLQAFELVQKFIDGSQTIAGLIPPDKMMAIYNSVVGLAGIEDPEKLRVTDEEMKQAMEQQAQAKVSESLAFKDLPPAGQIQEAAQAGIQLQPQDVGQGQPTQPQAPQAQPQQPQFSPGESQALQEQVQQWRQMGVPDAQIEQHLQTYLAQRGQNG
jgi:hypothetical protein